MVEEFIKTVQEGKGDSDQHLMTLFSIALACKGEFYIELGVRSGTTSLPILAAANLNGGNLESVDLGDCPFDDDHFKREDGHKFYEHKDAIEYLEELENKMLGGRWECDKRPPDFVYIDDWHSYDHVKKELEILDRIVTPSTVILIHDLMYGNTCPFYHTDLTLKDGQWANGGPYRAVAELNPQFWEFATLPWNNGLTILRKKYSNKYAQK